MKTYRERVKDLKLEVVADGEEFEAIAKTDVDDLLNDIENSVNEILSDIEEHDTKVAIDKLKQLAKELY